MTWELIAITLQGTTDAAAVVVATALAGTEIL